MKSNSEYISDYLEKYTTLLKKGELWRLRVTLNEFVKEIERIREYGIEQRKSNYLNEYSIQSNQSGIISVMLMDAATKEEMVEQFKVVKEAADIERSKEIPMILERIKHIQTPLKFEEVKRIYKWLFYKQITLEMLSENVLNEFKETRQYETLVKRFNKK